MRRGSIKYWVRLQRLNHFIDKLDAATALDSELHATFIGFSSMRDNLPARFWPKINELESESIRYLADKFGIDNKHKERISQQYWDLAKSFDYDFVGMSQMVNKLLVMLKGLMTRPLFDSIALDQFVQYEDADYLLRLMEDALGRSKKRLLSEVWLILILF